MKTFFFSDPHFGHYNIIEYQNRPFQTTEEMDAVMIENWNRVVTPNDHVYLLGDVSLHTPKKTHEILHQLQGTITLVLGNHDNRAELEKTGRFDLVSPYPILYDNFFLLSHEPIFVNEQCPFCNIYGHTHRNKFENTLLHVNVCAECVDYTPIPFDEVRKIVKERLLKYNAMKNKATSTIQ
ncbi:MAG: metallophosphoesterase family protein [Planctomycetaceae bacterium]|jgi:calcineurin-like phosphoesterase family protein|nr:metallophosphoesterase family protein [Planctomycetaceae bacterium]